MHVSSSYNVLYGKDQCKVCFWRFQPVLAKHLGQKEYGIHFLSWLLRMESVSTLELNLKSHAETYACSLGLLLDFGMPSGDNIHVSDGKLKKF